MELHTCSYCGASYAYARNADRCHTDKDGVKKTRTNRKRKTNTPTTALKAYHSAYYLENKARIIAYRKQYYQENKQRCKDYAKEQTLKKKNDEKDNV